LVEPISLEGPELHRTALERRRIDLEGRDRQGRQILFNPRLPSHRVARRGALA
jgi:hypothetical protein